MPNPPPRSLRGLVIGKGRRVINARGGRNSIGAGAPGSTGEGSGAPPPPPPPNDPPTVSITVPTTGTTITATPSTATISASDSDGTISLVELYVDGSKVGEDASSPYTVAFSPDNGARTLTAIATDNGGAQTTSSAVVVTINTTPPSGTALNGGDPMLVYSNEGASSVSSGTVSKMFGLAFRKGDVPTGEWPQFELEDTTSVPANVMQPAYWSDGSMRFASCIIRLPTGITAAARTFTVSGSTITAANHTDLTNGDPCVLVSTQKLPLPYDTWTPYYIRKGTGTIITLHPTAADATANTNAIAPTSVGTGTHTLQPCLPIIVKNGGAEPSASALTTSTITGNSDLKIEAAAAEGWTGTQTSAVNTGIGDAGVYVSTWGTGPCGLVLRVYQEFNDGSTDHSQAGVLHYVQALQNSSGGLYGLRHLGVVHNGWHDVTSPAIKGLSADTIVAKNGSTTIVTPSRWFTTKNWTYSGTTFNATTTFAQMVNTDDTSDSPLIFPARFTTTGTLPTGLTVGTGYWIRVTGYSWGGTAFTVHATHEHASDNTNAITPTDDDTGAHTMHFQTWIEPYGAGPAIAPASGEYAFITGTAGTGSEASGKITTNKNYLLSTKILPPYHTDWDLEHVYERDYAIDALHDIPYIGQSGPNVTMGQIDSFSARYMIRNFGRNRVRGHAMAAQHQTTTFLRKSTLNPINISNTDRTNMGTKIPTFSYSPGNEGLMLGANIPLSTTRCMSGVGWSHRAAVYIYPYIDMGEPHFFDMLVASCNSGLASVYGGPPFESYRQQTVGATTYYNVFSNADAERVAAWRYRDWAFLAMLASDDWNGCDLSTYAKSALTNDSDWVAALKATYSAWAQSVFLPPLTYNRVYMPWQGAFLWGAKMLAYVATEDADTKTDIEDRIAHLNAIRNQFGLGYTDTFTQAMVGRGAATSWDAYMGGSAMGGASMSWDATTDRFTPGAALSATHGAIADGVNFINAGTKVTIPGISNYTIYYVRDWNGTSFKLATTVGGAAIDITGTGSETDGTGTGGARSGGTNDFSTDASDPTTTASAVVKYSRWAQALGLSLPSGWMTAINAAYTAEPEDANNTAYMFKDTYTYP